MKSSEKVKKVSVAASKKLPDKAGTKSLQQQVDFYKKEREILLELSDDITRVREKNDMIKVFSSRLKSFFYFTHAVVSLIDQQTGTYFAFLIDGEAIPIMHRRELPSLLNTRFALKDPFIDQIDGSEMPVSFLLDDIIKDPGVPAFIKVNYECGIRKAMIARLKSKMETIGFVFIYSDQTDSFPDDFKNVINGIAPHLSNAVSNIIINEEIRHKEWVTETLLSLSNDMVTVRDRPDLLNVINFGLKKLIYFTHNVITELNETGETYHAFLIDPDSRAKKFPEYAEMLTMPNPVEDGIYNVASSSDKPVVFNMATFDPAKAPLWFKLNYEAGAKEMIIKILPGGQHPKHSIILFSDRLNNFDETAIKIIERISSQLSTAASNIVANEEILKKEKEKSFLLNFSNEIAAIRTKDDLELAINNVFENVLYLKLTMLRLIDDDGIHLTPYIYDKSSSVTKEDIYKKLATAKITIHEELSARVLRSGDPVIFNIEEEERQGNKGPYIYLWKKAGFKNAYGAPLRVGNTNLGTLWLLTNEVNLTILKGICAEISIAISNILANEKVLAYKQMLEIENDHLKEQIKTIYNSSDIVGDGPEMQRVYSMISLVAASNSTVLLLGETGTGKELAARAIHNASQRKDKLIVKVNCAALPANLIESELFGHEKGSFTGAIERRIGKFELANNSTLFLDEIGEMPLETQVKLLRVIQERELERVGGKATIKVDVRIIAATNRNLEDEVKAGRFRSDLYYRLNVFPISLPPLRNRVEDIEPLANFFLARYSKNTGRKVTAISAKVLKELRSYLWPGNVRELEHLIERSILLTQENVLKEIQLPKNQGNINKHSIDIANKSLQEVERSYIIETLKRCDGKIAGTGGAAEILDIPSTTLHSKLIKLNISKADYFVKSD